MAEKSILEQALLQIETLEEAVKQNAKGIISSTMKKELNDLLKESQEQEDESWKSEEEEQVSDDEAVAPEEEETDDMADDEESDDESDDESDEEDEAGDETDLDNDPTKDIDSLDTDGGDEEGMDTDDETSDDDSFEVPAEDEMGGDDEDVMDMTGASDEEVMKVFKAMKPEDGIVVKKDGNNLHVNDGEDEYIIKLDDDSSEESEPFTADADMGSEEEEDESIYEIALDEEDDQDEQVEESKHHEDDEEEDEAKKVQADEAARTKSNPHGDKGGANRAGIKSKKTYKAGSTINEEVETLKKQNGEYKKALVLFKDKLNEVAIFNANLAYFTRLVTEHSTTKQEKLNILKRFDSVSTMNESKNLFKTIESELSSKKPVTESVVNKISSTPTTSSSQETLTEAKAYENPQFKRMKDLMSKIK